MAALTCKRGRVISVATADNAGTISNNANILENVDGLNYHVVTGSEISVAAALSAGDLSNAANVIEN